MTGKMVGTIIILVLILLLILTVTIIVLRVRKKVREVSQAMFGTKDIIQGVKNMELQNEQTPKSVAAATSMFLPRIQRDFPEFQYEEMRARAVNVLESYLHSIDAHDVGVLTEGTNELKDKLLLHLQNLDAQDSREYFKEIKLHRTEISQYRKTAGRCSIVFQSSVQYRHYIERNGQLISGKKERLEQSRYNVEVIYIQDQDLAENTETDGLGLVCPNCGAPIKSLGAKVCVYCDAPIVEFNIRTWGFSRVEKA
ncbi:MAG: zinc ribbon domain-containing protein [Roseburia sp.]|nr:zinc ribbon domain-containing protein [Roseburia sp.]